MVWGYPKRIIKWFYCPSCQGPFLFLGFFTLAE
nr:MAG TPA: Trm112p-like protein [Caudoviricetes sp.]